VGEWVSSEVVGDARLKLLSCDRELQSARAKKAETSAGKHPRSQSTGIIGGELDFTVRRAHNHNCSIRVTWQYTKNQSFRYSVNHVLILYPDTDLEPSLSSTPDISYKPLVASAKQSPPSSNLFTGVRRISSQKHSELALL